MSLYEEQFETENYLHTLDDNCLFEFCKFRTLNHKLPIEYGRWHNIARNMHFRNLCNQNEIMGFKIPYDTGAHPALLITLINLQILLSSILFFVFIKWPNFIALGRFIK
jgi:hypothetical protein